MNEKNSKIIEKEYGISLDKKVLSDFKLWQELFENYNSHTNLMSKGDMGLIFEKHIFDSFAILKYENFDIKQNYKITDVGTGGGFPAIILAIAFRNFEIVAVDSIAKKTNFLKIVKDKLKLENLQIINSRIENIEKQNSDFVVSRAVGSITDIWEKSFQHLKDNGKFIIYKGKNYENELIEFKKKYKKNTLIVPYTLPTKEAHERFLIIV